MMRYGNALLACSYANKNSPSNNANLINSVSSFLTKSYLLDSAEQGLITDYLKSKPGSPRYTKIRRNLKVGKDTYVEAQDYLLASDTLPSSVGALSEKYYKDALSLARHLNLISKDRNILQSRGVLALKDFNQKKNIYELSEFNRLTLGIWLIDTDGDFTWSLLNNFSNNYCEQITLKNRIEVFLNCLDTLLSSRHLTGLPSKTLAIRKKLIELVNITKRNIKEGLNLGQPWSWFFIPRLELLVDCGILKKNNPGNLSSYKLTNFGERLVANITPESNGHDMFSDYFSTYLNKPKIDMIKLDVEDIKHSVSAYVYALKSKAGFMPLLETCTCSCYELNFTSEVAAVYEIGDMVKHLLYLQKQKGTNIVLGKDMYGRLANFKFKNN